MDELKTAVAVLESRVRTLDREIVAVRRNVAENEGRIRVCERNDAKTAVYNVIGSVVGGALVAAAVKMFFMQ